MESRPLSAWSQSVDTGRRCCSKDATRRTQQGDSRTNEGHTLATLDRKAGAVKELAVLVPAHHEVLEHWQLLSQSQAASVRLVSTHKIH
jgi:hypothetical protein